MHASLSLNELMSYWNNDIFSTDLLQIIADKILIWNIIWNITSYLFKFYLNQNVKIGQYFVLVTLVIAILLQVYSGDGCTCAIFSMQLAGLVACILIGQTMKRTTGDPDIHGLTHWGRVTHICVGKLTIIGWDNGLSPEQRQAIFWTNAGIFLIWPLGTNFREILIEIQTFSLKKIHLKMTSAKSCSFHLGLNVLK